MFIGRSLIPDARVRFYFDATETPQRTTGTPTPLPSLAHSFVIPKPGSDHPDYCFHYGELHKRHDTGTHWIVVYQQ